MLMKAGDGKGAAEALAAYLAMLPEASDRRMIQHHAASPSPTGLGLHCKPIFRSFPGVARCTVYTPSRMVYTFAW